jgi:two-component system, OmpR family, phosphate regulon sensor histidine kinase PhoR
LKRTVIAENLMIVLLAVVVTWVVTAFLFQNVLIDAKRSDLKSVLCLVQQYPNPQSVTNEQKNLLPQIEFIEPGKADGTPEVLQAEKTGYGEHSDSYNILSDSTVAVAGKLSNGTIIRVHGIVPGSGYTLLSILVAVLVAVVLIVRQASRIVTNIDFVFKGAAMTLERAGNEGGVTVNPAPETLQYVDLIDSAHELAKISTQVSLKVKELYIENKRIDYLLNNMNEGLVVFDRDMRILVINRSASRFFDAVGEMKGKNVLRLTHMPAIADALQGVTQSGEPAAVDIRNPDGKKTLQILMSAVHDEEENTDGAIMLISDVTEIRLAEQIRSEFVANASHELKTPLTSIKGFSELIDTGIINDPEKAHGYLEHIRTETERMIGLIGDILKLSELEATSHDTGMVQLSMKLIAQKVCGSLYNQINMKNVSVKVTGDIGSMEANPDHMEQMLLNLVDNAVKYNKPGGSVTVEVTQSEETVSVKVSDTGVGIPKESQQRVFERFYRVDKSRSRKLGGTGLGLSIVKHIVGLYNGKIKLESETGQGTSIEIILPVSNETDEF